MGNQVVLESFTDKDGKLQYRIVEGDSGLPTEVMKAQQGAVAAIFSDAGPAIGGGALAAFSGAVADKFLGGIGVGIVGNLGKAVPRVAAAWAIHQWGRRQWPTASKYAIAFLIYDAAKSIIDVDGMARNLGNQLASGLPALGGNGIVPVSQPAAPAGDPLLAGWT
jgi:hypothetical protein